MTIGEAIILYVGLVGVAYGTMRAGYGKKEKPQEQVPMYKLRNTKDIKEAGIIAGRKSRWAGLDEKWTKDAKEFGSNYQKLKYARIR